MDFNNEAAAWDTPQRMERAKRIGAEIRRNVQLAKSMRGLEFGAGTGLIAFELADAVDSILCVDTAAAMLDRVDEKAALRQVKNISTFCGAIESLERPTAGFDLAYASMALHHAANAADTLAVLAKLLNADGTLCIVDLNEDDGRFHQRETDFSGYHGFQQDELRTMAEAAGFYAVQSHTFYHGVKVDTGSAEQLPYSLFLMTGRKRSNR